MSSADPSSRRRLWIGWFRDAAIAGYVALLVGAVFILLGEQRIEQSRAARDADAMPMLAIPLGLSLGSSGALLFAGASLAWCAAQRFRVSLLVVLMFFAALGMAARPVSSAARWVASHATRTAGTSLTEFEVSIEDYTPSLPPGFSGGGNTYLRTSLVQIRCDALAVAFLLFVLALIAGFPRALAAVIRRLRLLGRSTGR